MIGEPVLAAMTGVGHANAGVCKFCIAGDAFADADWLIGGDVDASACVIAEGGADTDVAGAGVPSSSGPLVVSRRRF
jgi:hypothetical protein